MRFKFSHFILRDNFFGCILRCPACQEERHECRGIVKVGKHLQEMSYLACGCSPPGGVTKV